CLPLKSSFDCRFSFSAIAFRIIRTLHNIWSGNFSSDGQHTVKRKNLRQAHGTTSSTALLTTSCSSLASKQNRRGSNRAVTGRRRTGDQKPTPR
ncbi:hypothetical protein, partial [Rhizobium sp. 2TAF27]|uniref:hypothetical protein n=1 Tax=Rhizobium sp. 2TAF27 TaxID=3233013 RepID=UPI003F991708